MKDIPHISTVDRLMHAQVWTRPDIAYAAGKLDRYLCNPESDH